MEPQPFMKATGAAEGLQEAISDAGKDFIDYDPIGLPDQKDVENINRIIRNFEAACPGVIRAFVKQARDDKEAADRPLFVKKGEEMRRPVLTMPVPLLRDIEEAYPLMFRNRRHLVWFKTNFPMFNVR